METGKLVVTRVAQDRQWHVLEDDEVVGRSHAAQRPDGRLFVSIDSWHDPAFDALAEAMIADLPGPLWTVADAEDVNLLCAWERTGFAVRRREREYVVPTDPAVTGLATAPVPAGIRILPVGEARQEALHRLYWDIREEVDATIGWSRMPAEVLERPAEDLPLFPERFAVAEQLGDGAYVGLIRVAPLPRRPRIGLIAVRAQFQRRGIALALLAEVLCSWHRAGISSATAEVDESNDPARTLFEGVGARLASSSLELMHR